MSHNILIVQYCCLYLLYCALNHYGLFTAHCQFVPLNNISFFKTESMDILEGIIGIFLSRFILPPVILLSLQKRKQTGTCSLGPEMRSLCCCHLLFLAYTHTHVHTHTDTCSQSPQQPHASMTPEKSNTISHRLYTVLSPLRIQ